MHNFRVNYGSRRDISTTAALPTKRKLKFGEYFLLAILPSTSSLRSSGKRRVWWRFWTTIKVTGGSYPGSSFRQALRMAESSHWSTWKFHRYKYRSSGVNIRIVCYFGKLALADAISVKDDALRFPRRSRARDSVELAQQIVDHVLHILNVLLLRFLNADLATVLRWPRIDTPHYGRNTRFAGILLVCPGMRYICSHNYHLFLQEDLRTKTNPNI